MYTTTDNTDLKIAASENALQRSRRAIAEACSSNTPLSRKLFLAKGHRGVADEIRREMAKCPHMEIEVLRELYHDYPYLVSVNPQTPASLMDAYIDNGTALEQIGCFAYLAQAAQLSDDQWLRLANSEHVEVRRRLAESAAYLPPTARDALLTDEDWLVRDIAADAYAKAQRLDGVDNSGSAC